jgi:Glycosyl transferase family 2
MNGKSLRLLRQAHEMLTEDRVTDAMNLMMDEELVSRQLEHRATDALTKIADGKCLSKDVLDIAEDQCQRAMLSLRFFEQDEVGPLLPPELDSLASGVPVNFVTLLCHYANLKVAKSGQCSVVTSIRNEGPWLLEWVAHYIALGVKNIIIYHNDVDDGSSALIEALSRRKVIIVVENRLNASVSPQKKAYNAACQFSGLLHRSEWAAFLDSDEFVWPLLDGLDTIDDCINRICESSADKDRIDAIQLHWRWFSSIKEYEWAPGPVTRRFRLSGPNSHTKSIVNTASLWDMVGIHIPTLTVARGASVNSNGESIDLTPEVNPPAYGVAQVNHYFAKSFQEFSLKKKRGRGAVNRLETQREFGNFFWGAVIQATKTELPNSKLLTRTDSIVRELLGQKEILDAVRETERVSREWVTQLEAQMFLRDVHAELLARTGQ